jgi:hypothetical protein
MSKLVLFHDYVLFPNCVCNDNICLVENNDINYIKKVADSISFCKAFDTEGRLKSTKNFIYKKGSFCYVKKTEYANIKKFELQFKNFTFLPNKDSMDNDLYSKFNLSIFDLKEIAEKDDNCAGFNTYGYFKSHIKPQDELINLYNRFSNFYIQQDGLYVKKPKRNDNLIYVKLLSCYIPGHNDITEYFKKFSKNNDNQWNNIKFCNYDDADYFIIINAPIAQDNHYDPINIHFYYKRYDPKKTIVFYMEPSDFENTLYGRYWYNINPTNFLQIRKHKYFHNNSEWHISKNYKQLLNDEKINKTKTFSTIISDKYVLPGHIKRVNFVHYIESVNPDFIDIYGQCKSLNFKNYKGELPYLNKDASIEPYKYSFAAENSSEYNYFTEKIIDCILSECLCFYWGCPNIDEYFPNAFIRLELNDFEKDYQLIVDSINNNEWEKRLPFMRQAKQKILNQYQIFPTIEKVINTHNDKQLINNFFDKIFIISENVENYNTFIENLEKCNINNFHKFIVETKSHSAHLDIIKYSKTNNYNNILIIDDSIKFLPYQIKKLNLAIQEIIDLNIKYDMLYLYGENYNITDQISSCIHKFLNTKGSLFYSVNSSCFDPILQNYNNNDDEPKNIDDYYSLFEIHESLNCYFVYPFITNF